jgi:hypothetical protein
MSERKFPNPFEAINAPKIKEEKTSLFDKAVDKVKKIVTDKAGASDIIAAIDALKPRDNIETPLNWRTFGLAFATSTSAEIPVSGKFLIVHYEVLNKGTLSYSNEYVPSAVSSLYTALGIRFNQTGSFQPVYSGMKIRLDTTIKTVGFQNVNTANYAYEIRMIFSDEDNIDLQAVNSKSFAYQPSAGIYEFRPAKLDTNGYVLTRMVDANGFSPLVTKASYLEVIDWLYNVPFTTFSYDWAAVPVTAATVWTPANRFWLSSMTISVGATAGVVTVFEQTDTLALRIGKFYIPINGTVVVTFPKPYKSTVNGNSLRITVATATVGTISVHGIDAVA